MIHKTVPLQQTPSVDAREVIPLSYTDPTDLNEEDRNILDVTEISLELQGLLSSPQSSGLSMLFSTPSPSQHRTRQ